MIKTRLRATMYHHQTIGSIIADSYDQGAIFQHFAENFEYIHIGAPEYARSFSAD